MEADNTAVVNDEAATIQVDDGIAELQVELRAATASWEAGASTLPPVFTQCRPPRHCQGWPPPPAYQGTGACLSIPGPDDAGLSPDGPVRPGPDPNHTVAPSSIDDDNELAALLRGIDRASGGGRNHAHPSPDGPVRSGPAPD